MGTPRLNTRAKGQRIERKARALAEAEGSTVFPLYQPAYTKQGAIDFIAVDSHRIRFVQVRSNQWHDLRPLRALVVPTCDHVTKEAWRFRDGHSRPDKRLIA